MRASRGERGDSAYGLPEGFVLPLASGRSTPSNDLRSTLGFGEYRAPGHNPEDSVANLALKHFLTALDRFAPEVRQSLRDEVRSATQSLPGKGFLGQGYHELQTMARKSRRYPDVASFHGLLTSWAVRFHINHERLLEMALVTPLAWEVYEPLCRNVLPVYRPVAEKHGPLFVGRSCRLRTLRELYDFIGSPSAEWVEPTGALRSWAEKYAVPESGIVAAIMHLDVWTFAARPMWDSWALPPTCYDLSNTDYFKFSTFGWSPSAESRAVAKKRIVEAFERAIPEYLDKIDRNWKQAGRQRTPQSLNGEHFKWLVRYQVGGQRIADIVKEAVDSGHFLSAEAESGSARKQVAVAINTAAELPIGSEWQGWLRPRQKGAPKRRP